MRGADVDNNPFGAVEEDVDVDEDDISDEEEVVEGKDGAEYASGDEGGSCRCKAGGVLPEEERDRSSRMGEEACSEASISPSPGCREEQGKMDAIDEDRGPVAGKTPFSAEKTLQPSRSRSEQEGVAHIYTVDRFANLRRQRKDGLIEKMVSEGDHDQPGANEREGRVPSLDKRPSISPRSKRKRSVWW